MKTSHVSSRSTIFQNFQNENASFGSHIGFGTAIIFKRKSRWKTDNKKWINRDSDERRHCI